MLYTNVELEIVESSKGRVVELIDIYGHKLDEIKLDNKISNKLISINDKLHDNLSIHVDENNRINIVNEYNDDIYVILDLLDYKCFRKNSILLKSKDDKKITNENIIRYYRTSDRSGKCKWAIHIFKLPRRDFTVLKMITTSGKERYLVNYNSTVSILSKEELKDYTYKNNIKYKLNESDDSWELLRRI